MLASRRKLILFEKMHRPDFVQFLCMVLSSGLFSMCSNDVDSPVTIVGSWSTLNYIQVHEARDITSDIILWTDTIQYGKTEFEFLSCTTPCVIQPLFVVAQNVKTLQGSWEMDDPGKVIRVRSIANTYMTADTLINGHNYTFDRFLNGMEFEVLDLKANRMILRQGTLYIEFTRTN